MRKKRLKRRQKKHLQSVEKEDYDEKLKEVETRSGGAPGGESGAGDDDDHDEL
ncbi:hypothetical protein H5410_032130 [Solanum commersonii]|uniref:Uncharacterized protein n=1 Tax=Solanum commersonii TaxID=4109 RepID=A0A9J5YM34_SOLCO|nr:hypothetical protein H5410_032130 [Solanum commersonii]